jgi:DNA-binding CsgD family transcriptional regulator/PAS domain-containing protein
MAFRQTLSPVAPRGMSPWDPALVTGAMATLQQVLEATHLLDIEAFEPYALRQLGRLIGFDGAVWGSGVVASGPAARFTITRASVIDRPATLLGEYLDLAPHDPVTAQFLAQPDRPITVDVADHRWTRSGAAVGDYLRRHHIAHLMLLGCGGSRPATRPQPRRWMTVYRESMGPFDGPDIGHLQTLLPLWNQAHALCLVRQMERLARAHPVAGAAIALCDRSGLIMVAEPPFTALTGLREGDRLAGEWPAEQPASSPSATVPKGICLQWQDTGPWQLLQATREGDSAGLSPRERQVAQRYVDGLSHKEVAREIGSAPSTVRTQLQNIYRRLGVHSRMELLRALAAPGAD